MGNLWLVIGHAVREKVGGILVRSRACVGGGDANTSVYILSIGPSTFKIDRYRRRCFKWHTTEHTKTGQVAKAKQALLRSARYLGTNCLLCVAI